MNFIQILIEAFQEKPITFKDLNTIPTEEEMELGSNKHQYFSDKITPDNQPTNIINSLREYTSSSNMLNGDMWNNARNNRYILHSIPTKTDQVRNILRGISSYNKQLPEDIKVYSGLRSVSAPPTNSISHIPSFTSTSLDPRTAYGFAGKHGNGRHIIEISLPKGSSHGIYVRDISKHKEEEEYLLGANKVLHFHSPTTVFRSPLGEDIHIHHARILNDDEISKLPAIVSGPYFKAKSELSDIHDMPSENERFQNAVKTKNEDEMLRHINDPNILVRKAVLGNPYITHNVLRKALLNPSVNLNTATAILQRPEFNLSDEDISHFITHSKSPTLITKYTHGLKLHHQKALFDRHVSEGLNMFSLSKLPNLDKNIAFDIMKNKDNVLDTLDNDTINFNEQDVENIIDKFKNRHDFDSIFYRLASHHPLSKKAIDTASDEFSKRRLTDEYRDHLKDFFNPSVLGSNKKTSNESKQYFLRKTIDTLPEEDRQLTINRVLANAKNMGIKL